MLMKRMYILTVVVLATAFLRGDASVKNVQDPLVVNADTIKLRLENPRVRVLEATLKPGDKEKTHSHPAYVIYVIEGGRVRTHGVDGSATEADLKTGDVIYRDSVTHWAENIGKTTIRLVLVELKS
jgi:quercetin dioxygenase-like cupin family protein